MTIANDYLDVVDPLETIVVVLGGGRGTRLYPLTRDRAKPAVSFGGKYRLIDITLTNCLRSGFRRIFILTQFNSFSLNRHIWQTYSREMSRDGFVDVIAAEQTGERSDWFQGTADAVRQSLKHILHHNPRYVLILSADQIYCMDYRALLLWNETRHADVTIAGKYSASFEIAGLGVIQADKDLRVVGFHEKPRRLSDVADFRLSGLGHVGAPPGKDYLASMGIYLFKTPVLLEALRGGEEDFGKAVIPMTARRNVMSCYPFDGYWEDVGTIASFYQANMYWRAGRGIAAMFDGGNSIITHSRQLPPSRMDGTVVTDSLIADGCHVRAKEVTRSIIGLRSRIGEGTVIEDSIVIGNDAYDNHTPFEIGRNCVIRRAILDKNVRIGDGTRIEGTDGVANMDHDDDLLPYSIRSGIVVVARGAVIPQGSSLGHFPAPRAMEPART